MLTQVSHCGPWASGCNLSLLGFLISTHQIRGPMSKIVFQLWRFGLGVKIWFANFLSICKNVDWTKSQSAGPGSSVSRVITG